MKQPDTSPANVASMLRREARIHETPCACCGCFNESADTAASQLRALADALERQAGSIGGALTQGESHAAHRARVLRGISAELNVPHYTPWKDRVARGALSIYGTSPSQVDAILRAAFPEYAPTESESDD